MSLQFLNKKAAANEYKQTDYFAQMNWVELAYRLNSLGLSYQVDEPLSVLRNRIIATYMVLPMDFTPQERNVVNFYFKQLFKLLWVKAPALIPSKRPIGLIKLSPDVDWNFPYTINHSIVLPATFIKSLVDVYQQFVSGLGQTSTEVWNLTRPDYGAIDRKQVTLCHELIHILQRNETLYPAHKSVFETIYQQLWGFQKISRPQIKYQYAEEGKIFNVLTNPDGYNYQWIIPVYNHDTNQDHIFLPLLSRDLSNKPIGILVELQKDGDGDNNGDNNYVVTKHWNYIDRIKGYSNRFYGLNKQLYHPHEISAHLISSYVVQDQIFVETQDTMDFYKFYNFIKKYLISQSFMPFLER